MAYVFNAGIEPVCRIQWPNFACQSVYQQW